MEDGPEVPGWGFDIRDALEHIVCNLEDEFERWEDEDRLPRHQHLRGHFVAGHPRAPPAGLVEIVYEDGFGKPHRALRAWMAGGTQVIAGFEPVPESAVAHPPAGGSHPQRQRREEGKRVGRRPVALGRHRRRRAALT